MITIDGSQGEGGGQIVRSSISLSMITGCPISIFNIREGRKKPGLMRQHLTALKAAAKICNADTEHVCISSTKLKFTPKTIQPGRYRFAVGTAGSTTLILQTILPALLMARASSEIILEGGTHNPMAPPYDFLELAFIPLLKKMGCEVTVNLEKTGFYPAGGGRLSVVIKPAKVFNKIEILERGMLCLNRAIAVLNHLPESVGQRELNIAKKSSDLEDAEMVIEYREEADSAGNIFLIQLGFENICEVFCGFGGKGIPAEHVAKVAVDQAERYLKSSAPVGDYLADQLLVPLALSRKGAFRTVALTRHFHTNRDVIQKFIDVDIRCTRENRLSWLVEIG